MKMFSKMRCLTAKVITYLAGAALFCCLGADPERSDPMKVLMVMLVSGGWLLLVAWKKGWMMGTIAWEESEGDDGLR